MPIPPHAENGSQCRTRTDSLHLSSANPVISGSDTARVTERNFRVATLSSTDRSLVAVPVHRSELPVVLLLETYSMSYESGIPLGFFCPLTGEKYAPRASKIGRPPRSRTGTLAHGVLNPACLPIPPAGENYRHISQLAPVPYLMPLCAGPDAARLQLR